jgi:hypothetical protein
MMNLIEFPTPRPVGVSDEGGDLLGGGESPSSISRYRDMRWCANCGGQQVFVPVYEIEQGRVGFCFGCGEERIEAFTRMNSEVA